MNYESKLQFSIDSSKHRGAFESDQVELILPDHSYKISWKLKAVFGHKYLGNYLTLSLNSSDAITASGFGLSYSLQIKIEQEVFTLKEVRAINETNEMRFYDEDFKSESGKDFDLDKVLRENNLKVVINAKLTVMRTLDRLQRATKVLDLISSPDLADFTIQIGDKTWKVHKLILSARSPVFRRMLANKKCKEYKQSLLEIEDVTKDVFEHFLHFVYTGLLPNLPLKEASEVLIVADKYDVQELKDLCDDMMVDHLAESDPVHDIFQLAHALDCSKELKMKAFRFVKSSIQNITNKIERELVEKPEVVKKLVNLMKEVDETLQEGVVKKRKIEN